MRLQTYGAHMSEVLFRDLDVGQIVACDKMQVTGQFALFTELQDARTRRLVYVPQADPYYPEIPPTAYLTRAT